MSMLEKSSAAEQSIAGQSKAGLGRAELLQTHSAAESSKQVFASTVRQRAQPSSNSCPKAVLEQVAIRVTETSTLHTHFTQTLIPVQATSSTHASLPSACFVCLS